MVGYVAPSVGKNEVPERTVVDEEPFQGNDGDNHHLSGWPLAFLITALMASSFMLALDNTILGIP
tara:strand:- start:828 stop:1022 length:195 start_codon:yes stop_codon:yes gene_type:complete